MQKCRHQVYLVVVHHYVLWQLASNKERVNTFSTTWQCVKRTLWDSIETNALYCYRLLENNSNIEAFNLVGTHRMEIEAQRSLTARLKTSTRVHLFAILFTRASLVCTFTNRCMQAHARAGTLDLRNVFFQGTPRNRLPINASQSPLSCV